METLKEVNAHAFICPVPFHLKFPTFRLNDRFAACKLLSADFSPPSRFIGHAGRMTLP